MMEAKINGGDIDENLLFLIVKVTTAERHNLVSLIRTKLDETLDVDEIDKWLDFGNPEENKQTEN